MTEKVRDAFGKGTETRFCEVNVRVGSGEVEGRVVFGKAVFGV
jgi:hypothetical protein